MFSCGCSRKLNFIQIVSRKKTFMMTGAWEKTSSSEEPDTVRRQSRRRILRRRKVAQELDAQPSFGSADSPDHQIRIGNLVFRLIFAMMVAQVVAHRTKDRLRFTLLAGLFSLFSFLFLNQWCILYQEPHRGASLLLFWFPKNMLSSAAWGKASSMGNEWAEKKKKIQIGNLVFNFSSKLAGRSSWQWSSCPSLAF